MSYMVGSRYLPILYIVSIVYICHLYINGQAIGSSFQSCCYFSSLHCIQRVFSKIPHCSKDKNPYSFKRPKTQSIIWLFHLSVQFSSVAQSCPTLCQPMNHSMPGLPVHHQLPEFTQTHVHRVSDAIQPSHPLSSRSPPAPNPSQHQRLFQ